MDSTTMMALGDFRFSISTAAYTDLERSNEWRWPSLDRIGVRPARQFTGPGEETVNMRGTIYPGFVAQRRGLDQIPKMRAIADAGEPLMLVDGAGRAWGEFCIVSLREGQRTFYSDGTPRAIDFDISLVAYGG
jgi:phage protein U